MSSCKIHSLSNPSVVILLEHKILCLVFQKPSAPGKQKSFKGVHLEGKKIGNKIESTKGRFKDESVESYGSSYEMSD